MSTTTQPQSPVLLTSFEQLLAEAQKVKEVNFSLDEGGKVFAVKVRALSDEELAAANRHAEIPAPKRPNGMGVEEFDFNDPVYKQKLADGKIMRDAQIISRGVPDLKLPGATLKEQADYLTKNFPPRIITFLMMQILSITNGEVAVLEMANFTSGGPQEVSPAS